MNSIKVGDRLKIHCYKHNGKIHRTWDEATVLEIQEDMIVCANNRTKVIEHDGRSHRTNEIAILFFYKKRWFNIIAQLKRKGLFYYCNIATPFLIDEGIIKYIDYDLDLRVFPDGGYRILDQNEYNYHKKIMKYSNEIDIILKKELHNLIEIKKNEEIPFQKECIEHYVKIYENINNCNISN